MSYNIEVTDYFARQLKRLAKKYLSLRKEASELIESLETNPEKQSQLENLAIKSDWQSLQKRKGNLGEQELSLMFM